MEDQKKSFARIITNILLGAILLALIFMTNALSTNLRANRYAFAAHSQTHEIYVFDTQTGKLYITFPGAIDDYKGEVWAQLNPINKAHIIPFEEYLADMSGRNVRKDFLKKVKEQ